MGKQGRFKKELAKIMKSTEAKQWRAATQMQRDGRQVDPKLWMLCT